MPINDFICIQCGFEIKDVLHKMSEIPVRCPNCDKDGLKRILSTSGIIFKGTGFYQTDYKNK